MQPQAVHGMGLEAAGFDHLQGVADVIELGAGKDVLEDDALARADLSKFLDLALGAACAPRSTR
jgi:hypothetical protein